MDTEFMFLSLVYRCFDCPHVQEVALPDAHLEEMFDDHETWCVETEEYGPSAATKMNCPACGSRDFYAMEGNPGEEVLVDQHGIVSALDEFPERRRVS